MHVVAGIPTTLITSIPSLLNITRQVYAPAFANVCNAPIQTGNLATVKLCCIALPTRSGDNRDEVQRDDKVSKVAGLVRRGIVDGHAPKTMVFVHRRADVNYMHQELQVHSHLLQ
jgi:hypothetical protein